MLAKRLIACLDVRNGRVVKGTRFEDLADQGSPAELAMRYSEQGADEIVLLDVSATRQARLAFLSTVRKTASVLDIPLTVGGGVRSVSDAEKLLASGADKVSLNSAALENPRLVTEISERIGSQSVVVALDAKKSGPDWAVFSRSGSVKTSWAAPKWARNAQALGAGELLVTNIDRDGTKSGFDLDLLKGIRNVVTLPIIASGGAGCLSDFKEALGVADAVLAAGVFHSGKLSVSQVKRYLGKSGLLVRS